MVLEMVTAFEMAEQGEGLRGRDRKPAVMRSVGRPRKDVVFSFREPETESKLSRPVPGT